MIVNEFECCVFFYRSTNSARVQPTAMVLVFSSFFIFFISFTQKSKEIFALTKDTWSERGRKSDGREAKTSVMCTMNEWENEEKNTQTCKSPTFTWRLPPFHLAVFYFNTRAALLLVYAYSKKSWSKSLVRVVVNRTRMNVKYKSRIHSQA